MKVGMCLAIPGKVVELIGEHRALIDYGGTRREADVTFVHADVGDWVIVHAGFALQKLDEKDARETLDLWNEALELLGAPGGSG